MPEYTEHARHRMRQRHIDEDEVTEALDAPLVTYRQRSPRGDLTVQRSDRIVVVTSTDGRVVTAYHLNHRPPDPVRQGAA